MDANGNARLFGRGIDMTGQRTVSREAFRAWHFRQWRIHHRVQVIIPIHQ